MKKTQNFILILCLLFGVTNFSFSQDKLVLTLEDSIRMALSQNPNHLASKTRVEGAQHQVNEAASAFFPTLNAQGQRTLDEKVFELEFPSFIPGEKPSKVELDFTRDYQVSFAFSVPLFTSGRLKAGYKQAKYNLLSTEESQRQSRHDTVFNTKQAFYGVLIAKEFVSARGRNGALSDSLK